MLQGCSCAEVESLGREGEGGEGCWLVMMMMMGVLVWVGGGRLCSDHVGMCVVQAVW